MLYVIYIYHMLYIYIYISYIIYIYITWLWIWKEILPFVIRWIDLEYIVLRDYQKDQYYIIALICGI